MHFLTGAGTIDGINGPTRDTHIRRGDLGDPRHVLFGRSSAYSAKPAAVAGTQVDAHDPSVILGHKMMSLLRVELLFLPVGGCDSFRAKNRAYL